MPRVGVIGATGAVGTVTLELLADQVVGDRYPPLAARKRMLTGTASAMPEAVGR